MYSLTIFPTEHPTFKELAPFMGVLGVAPPLRGFASAPGVARSARTVAEPMLLPLSVSGNLGASEKGARSAAPISPKPDESRLAAWRIPSVTLDGCEQPPTRSQTAHRSWPRILGGCGAMEQLLVNARTRRRSQECTWNVSEDRFGALVTQKQQLLLRKDRPGRDGSRPVLPPTFQASRI